MTLAEKREIERKVREGQRQFTLRELTHERDKLVRYLHETKNDELRIRHAADTVHMTLTTLAGHLKDLKDHQEIAAMVVEIREYFSFCGYTQDNGLRYEQEYLAEKKQPQEGND